MGEAIGARLPRRARQAVQRLSVAEGVDRWAEEVSSALTISIVDHLTASHAWMTRSWIQRLAKNARFSRPTTPGGNVRESGSQLKVWLLTGLGRW